MDRKPKVAILMSTYNGENFIKEQINSILKQKDVELTLYVRDDGSKDNTITILKEYSEQIQLIVGENLGVGNSFMELIYSVSLEYDYYGFADQDDIWLSDKVIKAIESIGVLTTPSLYVSNQCLINADREVIGYRFDKNVYIDNNYMQILCRNLATGCTMLWNNQLQQLLSDSKRRPTSGLLKSRIHDVWVAMVCSVVGNIYYDTNGYIQYRQHDNNVVGVKEVSVFKEWREKINNPDLRNGRSMLAKEIIEKFSDKIADESIKNRLQIYAYYNEKSVSKYECICDVKNIVKYSNEHKIGTIIKIIFNLF